MTENYRSELSILKRRGERGASLMDVDLMTCDEMVEAGHAEWIAGKTMDRFRITERGVEAVGVEV